MFYDSVLSDITQKEEMGRMYSLEYVCYRWGCQHEQEARESYKLEQEKVHQNFSLSLSGFKINPQFPHIGATADGVVSCSCCGEGVMEIKCPFCVRDKSLEHVDFLAEIDGKLKLLKDHAYYYQVQMQMFVYDVSYADFVVWTQKDSIKPHIERIAPEPAFFSDELEKATCFYKKVILPNLLAKTFLAPITKPSTNPDDTCLCKEPASGQMLQCLSGFCKVKLFHLACMKLQRIPKRYICPSCRTIINREKREKKKLCK